MDEYAEISFRRHAERGSIAIDRAGGTGHAGPAHRRAAARSSRSRRQSRIRSRTPQQPQVIYAQCARAWASASVAVEPVRPDDARVRSIDMVAQIFAALMPLPAAPVATADASTDVGQPDPVPGLRSRSTRSATSRSARSATSSPSWWGSASWRLPTTRVRGSRRRTAAGWLGSWLGGGAGVRGRGTARDEAVGVLRGRGAGVQAGAASTDRAAIARDRRAARATRRGRERSPCERGADRDRDPAVGARVAAVASSSRRHVATSTQPGSRRVARATPAPDRFRHFRGGIHDRTHSQLDRRLPRASRSAPSRRAARSSSTPARAGRARPAPTSSRSRRSFDPRGARRTARPASCGAGARRSPISSARRCTAPHDDVSREPRVLVERSRPSRCSSTTSRSRRRRRRCGTRCSTQLGTRPRNAGPSGDGPFAHFDNIKTYDDLYNAQFKYLAREARLRQARSRRPASAAALQPIPAHDERRRAPARDVLGDAARRTSKHVMGHDARRRTVEAGDRRRRQAREAGQARRRLRRRTTSSGARCSDVAIHVAVADEAPTQVGPGRSTSVKDSVTHLPENLAHAGEQGRRPRRERRARGRQGRQRGRQGTVRRLRHAAPDRRGPARPVPDLAQSRHARGGVTCARGPGSSVAASRRTRWRALAARARPRARRRAAFQPRPLPGHWVWPVPRWNGRAPVISDGFDSPRPGLPRHGGVDIMFARAAADPFKAGTPNGSTLFVMPDGLVAVAASDGVVWSAMQTPQGFAVVIDHTPRKVATFYTHLEKLLVTPTANAKSGERVRAGQPIGIIGASPLDGEHLKHLHFELWLGGPNDRDRSGAAHARRGKSSPIRTRSSRATRGFVVSAGRRERRAVSRLGSRAQGQGRRLRDPRSRERARSSTSVRRAGRLYDTLTRHFQTWRRWKGFWRGQYGEGHDPGLTYDARLRRGRGARHVAEPSRSTRRCG